jgi:hypothetical protein
MVIVQSAVVLLAGQVLQTAATNASRLILTGQAQNSSYSAAAFKNAICANLTVMFNCTNNLYLDVESFLSFTTISLPTPTNTNGTPNNTALGLCPAPGDIVVVRLMYQCRSSPRNRLWARRGLELGRHSNTLVATVASATNPTPSVHDRPSNAPGFVAVSALRRTGAARPRSNSHCCCRCC